MAPNEGGLVMVTRRMVLRVWGSLEDPRKVTAAAVVGYAIALAGGVGFMLVPNPHPIPHSHGVLQILTVLLYTVGAVVGLPTAWTGKWWMERAAAAACLGGSAILLFDAAVLAWPGEPDLLAPVLTITAACFTVLWFAYRFNHVRKEPYAPGRGPETPEMQADKLLTHIMVVDHSHEQGGSTPN